MVPVEWAVVVVEVDVRIGRKPQYDVFRGEGNGTVFDRVFLRAKPDLRNGFIKFASSLTI